MKKEYAPITHEQMNSIRSLFDTSSFEKPEFEFDTKENGYYVTITKMYEYVTFKGISTLQGYLAIANTLGCENGDETNRHSYSGCETCDYGSSYTVKLRFW